MNRPENHVSRLMRKRIEDKVQEGSPLPEVPEALLLYLEALYPPRCYQPGQENLEAHLLYAGANNLVQLLRDGFDSQDPGDTEVEVLKAVEQSLKEED